MDPSAPIDLEWFRRHLLEEILPRWLAHATTPNGAFVPQLDREWRPLPNPRATLVSQTRLLFNFAQGWALTGEPAYREAVEAGGRFFLEAFRDREQGGWFFACSPEGVVLDERKDSYGHAFALFGMAHAFLATSRPEFRDAALHTWDVLDTRLRDPQGEFLLRTGRDFAAPAEGRSQNPMMHLFEALLAASEIPGLEAMREEAAQVALFVLGLRRPEDGLLPELYTSDWRPRGAEEGGRIDLGHAFEWAYLLSAGVEHGLPTEFLAPAGELLSAGLRLGFDAADGGIHSNASPNGRTVVAGKGFWQQCEALRALLHHHLLRGRQDLRDPLAHLSAHIRERFVDPIFGGWYSSLGMDGTPARTDKGSEWKVDYHVTGMCVEAIRLAAVAPNRPI